MKESYHNRTTLWSIVPNLAKRTFVMKSKLAVVIVYNLELPETTGYHIAAANDNIRVIEVILPFEKVSMVFKVLFYLRIFTSCGSCRFLKIQNDSLS